MTAAPEARTSCFQKLPLEVFDEIFSHLIEHIDVKEYGRWRLGSQIDEQHLRIDWESHLFDIVRKILREDEHRVWAYMQLRLVSKAFYRAVSRVFFQHEHAVLRACEKDTIPLMRRMFKERKGTLAPLIKHVRVELGDQVLGADYQFPWETKSVFDSEQGPGPGRREFFRGFLRELPKALFAIPKLESLVINLREAWCGGHTLNLDNATTQHVDISMVEELRDCLVTILASPTNKFEHLTYLRLMLPCTYDFAVLGNALSDQMLDRLEHLYLEYIDGTGPHGRKEYTRGIDWTDESEWEGFNYSNLQERYPNTEFAGEVWELVGRCRNLQSLGLVGTQPLDCESLERQADGSGLRNLFLKRATISSHALVKLLSPSVNHLANIEAIWLEDVVLTSGTWDEVFKHLLDSPSLKYFNPFDLVYTVSSPFCDNSCRPWEFTNNLWSERESDWERLEELIHVLVEKAGGMDHYPQDFNETYCIQ